MAFEQERSFEASSPVGRYWLLHCVGFRVEGARRRSGLVERTGRGADGTDLLFVRRDGLLRHGLAVVPATRVAVVDPWEETLVLARRSRRPRRELPAVGEHARALGGRLEPVAAVASSTSSRLVRAGANVAGRGAIAFLGLLETTWALFGALAVAARRRAPGARRAISAATRTGLAMGGAYASAGREVASSYRTAIAARIEARRRVALDDDAASAPLARDDTSNGVEHVEEEPSRTG